MKDPRLKAAILVCPAGLYSMNDRGEVELDIDSCLECGTCRIAWAGGIGLVLPNGESEYSSVLDKGVPG